MSDQPLFQNMDEEERIYAPEQLPADEQARVRADEGAVRVDPNEPPGPAPVANLGNAPSAAMAPPKRVRARGRRVHRSRYRPGQSNRSGSPIARPRIGPAPQMPGPGTVR